MKNKNGKKDQCIKELRQRIEELEKLETEHKKVKEALEESRRHFQTLFNTMADPVVIVDGKGKFLEITDRVEEITGFKKEELLGKNFFRTKIVTAKSKAILIKNLTKRIMGMEIAPYEIEVLTKDGRKVSYEVNAAKIEYNGKPADMVVFRDIADRKKGEEELRKSEERFSLFMDYLPAIVFIKDGESRTLYVNKHMNDVLGAKDWIGKTALELFPKDIAEAMIADDKKALAEGYQMIVETVPDKHGINHIYQTQKFSIERSGKSPLLGGIALDITERKKLEEILEKQREELSAFAHTVSHDLKNYIGIIQNSAQFSLMKKETAEKNAQRIIDTTKKMEEFVTRQLELADAGKAIGKLEEIDLNILIDEVGKSHSIKIHRDDLPAIKGDPQKLKEAFHNLIDNAIKHGEADRIEISSEKKKDSYVIYVKDNGKGIPKEDIDKIFDMGYSKTGTGFGLTIVKKIVEAHDGRISMKSEVGEGTIFEIMLPIKA